MIAENVSYFDSFGIEHIPKEIRIQEYDSIMCGSFCIGFTDFMLTGKNLLGYRNSFYPNEHKNNVKIISKYFQ